MPKCLNAYTTMILSLEKFTNKILFRKDENHYSTNKTHEQQLKFNLEKNV